MFHILAFIGIETSVLVENLSQCHTTFPKFDTLSLQKSVTLKSFMLPYFGLKNIITLPHSKLSHYGTTLMDDANLLTLENKIRTRVGWALGIVHQGTNLHRYYHTVNRGVAWIFRQQGLQVISVGTDFELLSFFNMTILHYTKITYVRYSNSPHKAKFSCFR